MKGDSKDKKRGHERIRTAVGAFAELSLATRPRDLSGMQKYRYFLKLQVFGVLFFVLSAGTLFIYHQIFLQLIVNQIVMEKLKQFNFVSVLNFATLR